MELVAALDKSFNHTHSVLLNVSPEHYALPTPCSEWTVQELLNHAIGVVEGLGCAAAGTAAEPFVLGEDPAGQFRAAADATLAAWATPGVMERIINGGAGPMPGSVLAGINLLDTTTHAWDLAVALGRPASLPDDVAEVALENARTIVSDEIRPGRFAPAVAPGPDAGATERLVCFLGRRP
jgi:uncharacterized protein (TIGR03086 family)